MGLMNEYIDRHLTVPDMQKELLSLIGKCNKLRNTYGLVFVTAIQKINIPDVQICMDDYYIVHDLLRDTPIRKLDVYLETPGGSGEAAEEIVRCLRSKFDEVSFIISGEAKSAGTIMALSADEIYMTETGSLGPIDAQIRIGRSVVSAFDYQEWVEQKRTEAEASGKLNPFDANMVAQISPGEYSGVINSLKFAEDLVTDWLPKYKFKNWTETEKRKVKVSPEMRIQAARKIAAELTNHGKWRSHGRSLKISDLNDIGLKINRVEDSNAFSDIVYRIQTLCRLIFASSNIYKIFATENAKVFKNVAVTTIPGINSPLPIATPEVAEFEVKCTKCGTIYKLYAKLIANPKIDQEMKSKGSTKFPKDNILKCTCGEQINLTGIRNNIELQTHKKIVD